MRLPAAVKVAPVVQKTVPVQIKTFGNVQAYASVAIRAQVNVELKTIGFKGGTGYALEYTGSAIRALSMATTSISVAKIDTFTPAWRSCAYSAS